MANENKQPLTTEQKQAAEREILAIRNSSSEDIKYFWLGDVVWLKDSDIPLIPEKALQMLSYKLQGRMLKVMEGLKDRTIK